MDPTLARVAAALAEQGAAGSIVELPHPAPTADAAAEQLGCEVGAVANSVVFAVDGSALLVLTSGGHRVDTRRLATLLGVARRRIRPADHDFVGLATGQQVGGIAPVGHPQRIRTLVDVRLKRHQQLWAGAGLRHAVFATSFAELVRLTDGEPVDVGEQ
ncbi:YbaK/EbsC family protein [Streptacidiphilus sp. PB12-B1b]|uniref:YbaK/EbsC family protein n=1 Tax=Streptacidiphilus sp. PB12-B1b TaxID=2705012 RepID=UPI0015F7C537|nr:YbaK/EbsC family protein [Streptacidiphilus sp. PB12-B1b]QMU78291.1 YbaK/EbsC family protein [Streptacidiphilus sp. PB12-B1b]